MKTTCLIDTYNTDRYIIAAVESVLNQSVEFDEIIVVDDGSPDRTREILQEKYGEHPQIKLIFKDKNEGQLSTINTGCAAVSGDIIFFMDGDDKYGKHYLESALSVYNKYPECDFIVCGFEIIDGQGLVNGQPETETRFDPAEIERQTRDLGFSVLMTLYNQECVGGRTVTLSMKRTIVNKIFPVPYVEEWRIRADDCLNFGSSIVGARKFRLALPLVKWRVHGENNLFKKSTVSIHTLYRRQLALNRFFAFLSQKMKYWETQLPELAFFEFKNLSRPSWRKFQFYVGLLANSQLRLSKKIKGILVIVKYMFFNKSKIEQE